MDSLEEIHKITATGPWDIPESNVIITFQHIGECAIENGIDLTFGIFGNDFIDRVLIGSITTNRMSLTSQ